MLRRALRSFASWLGFVPPVEATEGEGAALPVRLDLSTHLSPQEGRARFDDLVHAIKSAPVPRGRVAPSGFVATMDAAEGCNTSVAGGVFGELDENVAVTDAQLGWFGSQRFIGYQMAAVLMQHWLIDKACSMPARDAVRNWLDVSVKGVDLEEEQLDQLRDRIDRLDGEHNLRHHAQEFIRMGRGFGIRLALFAVDLGSEAENTAYYEAPFNPDGVTPGSYLGIRQVDQYWCGPVLDDQSASDPLSPNFYEPTWWNIGGRKYHRSHFCIFRAAEVPDNLKPYYLYGGVPLPQRIMERVYGAERAANEGPLLLLAKRLYVWKTNLEDTMADPDAFLQHVAAVSNLANNFGFKVIDQEDAIESHDTALADVDTVIMGQFQLVAATANVPATKLLGTTPKGFQSTGDAETRDYSQELETVQTNDLTPLIDRHHLMLMRSVLAEEFGLNPEEARVSHVWASVDTPTAKERAEINKLNADTDNVLVTAGIIDQEEARGRLRADPESGYEGLQTLIDESELDEDTDPEA